MKTIGFTTALITLMISHRAFPEDIRLTAAIQSNFGIALWWNTKTDRVYPGRTDSTFQTRLFYANFILLELNGPSSDIGIVLADYQLALDTYYPLFGLFVTRVTRKTDDPLTIAAALNADPRIKWAELDGRGDPRDSCLLPP